MAFLLSFGLGLGLERLSFESKPGNLMMFEDFSVSSGSDAACLSPELAATLNMNIGGYSLKSHDVVQTGVTENTYATVSVGVST